MQCMACLANLPPLYANTDLLAVAYGLQLGDADLDPRCVEVLEENLGDAFGKGFQQRKVTIAED